MTAMPLGHCVVHCHDHWDTPSARWASSLTDHAARALVLNVPEPGPGQAADVAAHLAIALGHPTPHTSPDKQRDRPRSIDDLAANVIGYRPADLVVHRAHWLPADTLQTLLQLAAVTDTRVWLITTPPITRADTAHVIGAWAHPDDTLTWPQAQGLWQRRTRPGAAATARRPAPSRRAAYPAVPDSHFTSFRTRAATKLSHAQRRHVNAELDQASEAARQLAYELSATWHDHESLRRDEALATQVILHLLEHHHPDPAIATTRLRGMQEGLLRQYWHLDAGLARYLRATGDIRTDYDLPANLNALLATVRADSLSAAVLTVIGIPAAHTWRVRIDDVSPDGSELTWHGQTRAVPSAAQRHLAAARAARLHSGASADDPLYPWLTTPPFAQHVREATTYVLTEYGASTPWQASLQVNDALEAFDRLGLRLTRLPRIPAEVRTGPAPHARYADTSYTQTGRVTADPRHTRRLTDTEAAVLACGLNGMTSAGRCAGAVVQRALVNLRAAGLVEPT